MNSIITGLTITLSKIVEGEVGKGVIIPFFPGCVRVLLQTIDLLTISILLNNLPTISNRFTYKFRFFPMRLAKLGVTSPTHPQPPLGALLALGVEKYRRYYLVLMLNIV